MKAYHISLVLLMALSITGSALAYRYHNNQVRIERFCAGYMDADGNLGECSKRP